VKQIHFNHIKNSEQDKTKFGIFCFCGL